MKTLFSKENISILIALAALVFSILAYRDAHKATVFQINPDLRVSSYIKDIQHEQDAVGDTFYIDPKQDSKVGVLASLTNAGFKSTQIYKVEVFGTCYGQKSNFPSLFGDFQTLGLPKVNTVPVEVGLKEVKGKILSPNETISFSFDLPLNESWESQTRADNFLNLVSTPFCSEEIRIETDRGLFVRTMKFMRIPPFLSF